MALSRRVMTPGRDDTSPSLCSLCVPHSAGPSVFTFGNLWRPLCPVGIYRFMRGVSMAEFSHLDFDEASKIAHDPGAVKPRPDG